MKKILYFAFTAIAIAFTTTSCSSDDNSINSNVENLPPYKDVEKIVEGDISFNIETRGGEFYAPATSPIIVTITDNKDPKNTDFSNTKINITMHMTMANGHKMSHSAPLTQLKPIAGTTNKFEGELMFIMAGTEPGKNYWDITLETKTKGETVKATKAIVVNKKTASQHQSLQSFTITDNGIKETYWIAMHEIANVKTGKNPFSVSIFKSLNGAKEFSIANNFQIDIDPRMPTMANHGVGQVLPTLKYNATSEKYEGTIMFNMDGYWYINLLIKDLKGNIIAGQFVEEKSQINSDKFFELEFTTK